MRYFRSECISSVHVNSKCAQWKNHSKVPQAGFWSRYIKMFIRYLLFFYSVISLQYLHLIQKCKSHYFLSHWLNIYRNKYFNYCKRWCWRFSNRALLWLTLQGGQEPCNKVQGHCPPPTHQPHCLSTADVLPSPLTKNRQMMRWTSLRWHNRGVILSKKGWNESLWTQL